jgi:hypothetical protein
MYSISTYKALELYQKDRLFNGLINNYKNGLILEALVLDNWDLLGTLAILHLELIKPNASKDSSKSVNRDLMYNNNKLLVGLA